MPVEELYLYSVRLDIQGYSRSNWIVVAPSREKAEEYATEYVKTHYADEPAFEVLGVMRTDKEVIVKSPEGEHNAPT